MAIEVTSVVTNKTVEELDFPVLMRSNLSQIVLFTSKYEGTCLDSGSSDVEIGWSCNRWVSCYDSNTWEKYEGKITLKNK